MNADEYVEREYVVVVELTMHYTIHAGSAEEAERAISDGDGVHGDCQDVDVVAVVLADDIYGDDLREPGACRYGDDLREPGACRVCAAVLKPGWTECTTHFLARLRYEREVRT